jgi:N-formylglutamate amidohydrolase
MLMTFHGLDAYPSQGHVQSMAQVLLHLPHASRYIPLAERGGLAVDDAEIERQHLALVDDRTDELFAPVEALNVHTVTAAVSRLVVDVERRREDSLEPAAALGMGAVYTRGVDNVLLRPSLVATERERLLKTWYDQHHQLLDQTVAGIRRSYTSCVLIDAHSYPLDRLPTELEGAVRPEICIGVDPDWSRGVEKVVERHFIQSGYTVALNQPYVGSMVPNIIRCEPQRNTAWNHSFHDQMAPCKGFFSVMIEVRRDVYLRRDTQLPGPRFNHLKFTLNMLYRRLGKLNFWTGRSDTSQGPPDTL